MMNKRGQGLSINAIILIILAVVVLVVLILGFTTGWGFFKNIFGGSNNVDTLANSCSIACSTNAQFDFCEQKRELKIDKETDESLTEVQSGMSYSCKELYDKAPSLGIDNCLAIPC